MSLPYTGILHRGLTSTPVRIVAVIAAIFEKNVYLCGSK